MSQALRAGAAEAWHPGTCCTRHGSQAAGPALFLPRLCWWEGAGPSLAVPPSLHTAHL